MVQPPPGPPNAARPGGFQPPPPPPPPVRSGAVNAVAIVNFVLGGLRILAGSGMLFCGAALAALITGAAADGSVSSGDAGTAAAVVGVFVTVVAILIIATGIPMIAAGYGVHKRAPWGRILTLVLGGLSGIFAIFSLLSFNIVGIVIEGGYCAMAFAILLNPEYAAEFR